MVEEGSKGNQHRQSAVCLPVALHNLRTAAGELADTHTAQQTSQTQTGKHLHTGTHMQQMVTWLFCCFFVCVFLTNLQSHFVILCRNKKMKIPGLLVFRCVFVCQCSRPFKCTDVSTSETASVVSALQNKPYLPQIMFSSPCVSPSSTMYHDKKRSSTVWSLKLCARFLVHKNIFHDGTGVMFGFDRNICIT